MKNEIEEFIKVTGSDPKIRLNDAVAYLLLHFEHTTLFNIISDYMNNPSVMRREWIICIRTLVEIDRIEANKRFVEVLQNDDADKRFRIVKLLGSYGTEHIVQSLIKMLKDDPEPGIRFMVASTLGDIGDKRALPALEWSAENDNGVNHEDSTISSEARLAIEKILSGEKKW